MPRLLTESSKLSIWDSSRLYSCHSSSTVTFKDCWRFRSFCFQPTYEELKRDMVIPNRYMQIQFSAYLWGIETSIRINSYTQTQVQFSAYLWGIETSEGGKHESF